MSVEVLSKGNVLRIETVSGNISYTFWCRTNQGLYQYRHGKWIPRKRDGEVIAKSAKEWYSTLEKTMKEPFTAVEILHEHFVACLRQDSRT